MAHEHAVEVNGVEYLFDFDDERIDVPSSVDALSVPDMWTAIKIAHHSEVGVVHETIATASGLDELDPGISTYLTVTLLRNWEINSLKVSGKFTTRGGNVRRADGEDPFRDNPLITYIAFLSQAGTVAQVETGVSGLTASESSQLAAAASGAANCDVPVSSRLAAAGYTAPPTVQQIAAQVWDRSNDALARIFAVLRGRASVPSGAGAYEFRNEAGDVVESGTIDAQGNRTPDP